MSQFDSLDKAFAQIDTEVQSDVSGGNWVRRLVTSPGWSGFVNVVNYIGNSFET